MFKNVNGLNAFEILNNNFIGEASLVGCVVDFQLLN